MLLPHVDPVPLLLGNPPHTPRVQVLVAQGPMSGQSDGVIQATQLPSASHFFEPWHGEPTVFFPCVQAPAEQVAVPQSALVGVHWVIAMVWPSALQVATLSPEHVFCPGIQVLQVIVIALQPVPMHGCWSAKSEPSALHIRSVLPSGAQVIVFGMHFIEVHAPASSLHNASLAHGSFMMYCPSAVQTLRFTPSQ
jgi:hypothetical protein